MFIKLGSGILVQVPGEFHATYFFCDCIFSYGGRQIFVLSPSLQAHNSNKILLFAAFQFHRNIFDKDQDRVVLAGSFPYYIIFGMLKTYNPEASFEIRFLLIYLIDNVLYTDLYSTSSTETKLMHSS